ncbi:site-specific integrase [Nocardia noduli]|uniref:site-specific integrase n=1 Tax=Nocardia noduli TaxID=2815722 RepID=UPI001C21F618|nr:site-specific integrase [Nocardia noduli]
MFDQDVWDFTGVVGLPRHLSAGGHIIDFTAIEDLGWRMTSKEYIFALLSPHHDAVRLLPGALRTPLTISTCRSRLRHLRQWLGWLTSRGIRDLADVDQYHCDAFLLWSHHVHNRDGEAVGPTSPEYRLNILTPVKELSAYAELFTAGAYRPGFEPWPGRTVSHVLALGNRGENSTPPVRQDVLQPLLAAAFFVTEELAEHILELRDREREREHAWQQRFDEHRGADGQWAAIARLVRQYVRTGRPLPRTSDEHVRSRLARGWDRHDPLLSVSTKRLAYEAGIRHPLGLKIPADRRAELFAAVDQVGTEHPIARNAAHVSRADGRAKVPWTLPLPGHTRPSWLVQRLRTACLVIVAAVTGMRMSEIVELPVDCRLAPVPVADGLVRYRIKSKRIKGQPHGGTWDEWVVVEQVHHALGLLHRLRDCPTSTHLLEPGPIGFAQRLTSFRAWVNSDDGRRLGLSPIPGDPVNLKMLRRTLALELAHRPGGVLAAKVHLKHISVATTEGYAARPGGSQTLFLTEIAHEESRRNQQLTMQAFEDYRNGIRPSGPGAGDLVAFFESVDRQLDDDPPAPPAVKRTDRELAVLLGKRADTLHLGVANYCWFADPSKALCLKLAGTPFADKPLAGMCDSSRCPQATHHPCHRPAWQDAADTTTAFLGALGRRQTTEKARLRTQTGPRTPGPGRDRRRP